MQALRPMTEPEYAAWLAGIIPAYAADKVASGQWSATESVERSTQEYAQLLPHGLATPDNHHFTVEDARGKNVGVLWFAVKTRFNKRIAYLFNIQVKPEYQRQGNALAAMEALEAEVLRLDLQGIALHVFGHNEGARALYAKLGFQPTSINLYKPIGAAEA